MAKVTLVMVVVVVVKVVMMMRRRRRRRRRKTLCSPYIHMSKVRLISVQTI
jgi:hypothetical protein